MNKNKFVLAKTISWHILHITMAAIIALIVTGSFKLAAILASLELIWESFMYFMHEHLWEKIRKTTKFN